ncbi:response regulator [Paenibacillus amylolyticus]|nr:response regulator [Paenibacillus amylolyticus]
MLKLLLQPLVENAIYHGLENKRGKGSVTITGLFQEDSIVFEIWDDGVGMSSTQAEELRQLLQQPPEFVAVGQRHKQSIGIKNVHSRIALYYGEGYGLSFHTDLNTGTRITLKFRPIGKRGDQEMYTYIVVDDEPLIRKGLLKKIGTFEHSLELLGEADNGADALALIESFKPDIIFTDMRMPEVDGKLLIRTVCQQYPAHQVNCH